MAAEQSQADFDGVHAIGYTGRVLVAPVARELNFELADFVAEDVPAALADSLYGAENVGADVSPLALEIIREDHTATFMACLRRDKYS